MKKIFLPIIPDYQTLICRTINREQHSVMMVPINEHEEDKFEKDGMIRLKRGNLTFNIKAKDVYCYGEIDFSNGSEDMETIADFNWLDFMTFQGVSIPANYNYSDHSCLTDGNDYKTYDTTRPEVLTKYKHGVLGKPERVIIFRFIKYGK